MKQLRLIWFIALKDLKLFATDRGALFFFILFPFLFIALFNFMNLGASEDTRLELHIVTQEVEGGLSYQIIGMMETKDEAQLKPGEPKMVWLQDYDKAYQMVEDEEIGGFLAFPANFTEGIMAGSGAQLEVVADAEATNDRTALHGLAQAISSQVGSVYITANASIELMIEQGIIDPTDTAEIERVIQQILSGQDVTGESLIEFETEKVGTLEEESAANWVVSGYLVMFVFFAAAIGAEVIVRERQNHTWSGC